MRWIWRKKQSDPAAEGLAQLRQLLRQRASSVAETTLKADGVVSEVDVANVERLARLSSVVAATQPAMPRSRWPMAVTFIASALLVGVLLSHTRKTEVELELVATDMKFVSVTDQRLTPAFNLRDLALTGLAELEIPRSGGREAYSLLRGDSSLAIRMSTVTELSATGTLSLEGILAPAGTEVTLRRVPGTGRYRLRLKAVNLELRIAVRGAVAVTVANGAREELRFPTPRPVTGRAGRDGVTLEFQLPDSTPGVFAPLLEIRELSFNRIEETVDRTSTVVRRVSTIASGKVVYQELGQDRQLNAGEMLRFGSINGELRSGLALDDGFEIRVRAMVKGMSLGTGSHPRSIMPRRLEWLRQQHAATLYWGTCLYLFGILAALVRWVAPQRVQ